MMKALIALSQINPGLFSAAATRQADRLLARADAALVLDEEKQRLRALAARLVCATA
jgi:hypothetical protein